MGTTSAIAAIRTALVSKFSTLKMLVTGATVTATAKNSNLINKITFLQNCIFTKVKPAVGSFLERNHNKEVQIYFNNPQTTIK